MIAEFSWESVEGMFCLQVVGLDRSKLERSKMDGWR